MMDNRQSQVGLCVIEALLASTLVGVMMLTLLSIQWSMQVHMKDLQRQQLMDQSHMNAFELLQSCQSTSCRQAMCDYWQTNTAIRPFMASGVCECQQGRCHVTIDWVDTSRSQSSWWL